MNDLPNLIENELVIDNISRGHLSETATWGKFLGIVGFVYSLLVAVAAIFAGSVLSKLMSGTEGNGERILAGGSVAIIYLVLAGVIFFMSLYLFRFSKNIQLALLTNDQATLSISLKNLKVYFRFAGIITAIALIFTFLGVVGLMLASSFG
ncbi:hypothetical protein BH11BAC3_BH11BAC3_43690 [soil metagenome]